MARSDRLFALAHLLAGPKRHRLDELTARLETTPRTIYRDLAALESRGIPIERVEGTYRLMDGVAARPLPLSSQERVLLGLALDNPSLKRQPSLARTLRQLRLKLAGQMGDEPATAVLSGPERSGTIPAEILEPLEEAVRSSHSVSILYTSLSNGIPEWRGIDPWVIFHRSEAWYLGGRCHVHDDLRTFRLDRVTGVLPIGKSFVRPPDFDVEEWLGKRWGVYDGEPAEAVIVFEPALAPLIEHGRHHPTESKRRLEDGHLEYRVETGSIDELARWVAGFGGKAAAVAPPVLVERVRDICAGALAAHRERKPPRRSTERGREEGRVGGRRGA